MIGAGLSCGRRDDRLLAVQSASSCLPRSSAQKRTPAAHGLFCGPAIPISRSLRLRWLDTNTATQLWHLALCEGADLACPSCVVPAPVALLPGRGIVRRSGCVSPFLPPVSPRPGSTACCLYLPLFLLFQRCRWWQPVLRATWEAASEMRYALVVM